ncbi:sulfotransferase [Oceanibium sediminis]|uniref:sulfotransferase n=1 Tax=Oceanibium sediminis TaxID=2026339 RepID=UPI000DD43F98|nr:sulfotransferase [Oceanibium sediminis]
MPNASNIKRPMTFISYGRSGTSLAFNILAAHPDVDGCGETAQMLHGVWDGSQRLKGVVRPDRELGPDVDHRERSGKAVRAAFLSFFDNPDKPHWVHKPINVPQTIRPQQQAKPHGMRRAGENYWDAMRYSFPDSTNMTILRHPYDVLLSAIAYWGFTVEHIWRQLVNMAILIDHEQSDITFALSHQRLVEDPDTEIRRLLDHVGLEEHPACFEAAGRVYVPRKGAGHQAKESMTDHTARAFSHKAKWDELDTSSFTRVEKDIIAKMWARFGEELTF